MAHLGKGSRAKGGVGGTEKEPHSTRKEELVVLGQRDCVRNNNQAGKGGQSDCSQAAS